MSIATTTNSCQQSDEAPFFSQSANSVFACDKFEQRRTFLDLQSFQARLIHNLDSQVIYSPQLSDYFEEKEAEKERMGTELMEIIEELNKSKQKKAKFEIQVAKNMARRA